MAFKQFSPLPVIEGGTNTSSFPFDHGVIVFEAGQQISINPGTAGQVLTSNGVALPPTFQPAGGGGITTLNGNSGSATGSTVTIAATGGLNTSATGSTVTISGAGIGITWSEQTGATVALVSGNGYIMNRGTIITATLPATAAVGDVIAIVGKGSGGWTIVENSGQTMHFGAVNTTTTTGSLSSTNQYDCLEMVCITANTDFVIRYTIGNITYV